MLEGQGTSQMRRGVYLAVKIEMFWVVELMYYMSKM